MHEIRYPDEKFTALYYGTLPLSMIAYGDGDISRHIDHQLDKWHINRCNGIVSRIMEDPEFALRVRTLKVYASGRHNGIQMCQFHLTIDEYLVEVPQPPSLVPS